MVCTQWDTHTHRVLSGSFAGLSQGNSRGGNVTIHKIVRDSPEVSAESPVTRPGQPRWGRWFPGGTGIPGAVEEEPAVPSAGEQLTPSAS